MDGVRPDRLKSASLGQIQKQIRQSSLKQNAGIERRDNGLH
jgi:hypothetical protein